MRIFIRKIRAVDLKYALLSKNLHENKYPCGLKNFAMALVQTQSNGIQSTPVYQKWSCTRAFYSKNHLWKNHFQGCILHVWSENHAFEYWTKQVPINVCILVQNKWTQSSCTGVSISPSNLFSQCSPLPQVLNKLQGENMQGPSGYCSLRDIVHFGPQRACGACRR